MKKITGELFAAFLISCCLLNGCSAKDVSVTTSGNSLHQVESFVLSKYDSTELTLEVGGYEDLTFYVEPESIDEKDIEIVNENEDVAKVLLQDIRNVVGNRLIMVSVRGRSLGETNVKIRGIENNLESDTVHVSIIEKQESTDTSRIVYVNLNGNKYHLSSDCAGKSAYITTENEALKSRKEPCSKCIN